MSKPRRPGVIRGTTSFHHPVFRESLTPKISIPRVSRQPFSRLQQLTVRLVLS